MPQNRYFRGFLLNKDMNTIYHLIANIPDINPFVFYVGRTSDPTRRAREHASSIAKGTEDKYVFIRTLQEIEGATWQLVPTTADCEFSECLRAARLNRGTAAEEIIGCVLNDSGRLLTNMRDGDLLEALYDPKINSLKDLRSKQLAQKQAAERRPRSKASTMSTWGAAHDLQCKRELTNMIMDLDDGVSSFFALNRMRAIGLQPNEQNRLFFLCETASPDMSKIPEWRLKDIAERAIFAVDCGWILHDCPFIVELEDELRRRGES